MSTPRIAHLTREEADTERQRAALGEIYAFILQCHQRKGTAPPGDPEITDGTATEGDSARGDSIQQTPK